MRLQSAWATSVSRNLNEKWGVTGEVSGTHQRGPGSTSQGLVAGSYSVSPAMSIDFGVSKGFNAASNGWSMFSGVTFLAAKLF